MIRIVIIVLIPGKEIELLVIEMIYIRINLRRQSDSLCLGNYVRIVFDIGLGILIGYLSVPIVQNLLSSRQIMNTSFDPLRIVNTYGAFGRYTVVVKISIISVLYSLFKAHGELFKVNQ